uniref:Uncharacterized protein n=1 Tax=Anguilla anguilla TaxID=7936 RepID=A0A0E9QLM5_ANGAN
MHKLTDTNPQTRTHCHISSQGGHINSQTHELTVT